MFGPLFDAHKNYLVHVRGQGCTTLRGIDIMALPWGVELKKVHYFPWHMIEYIRDAGATHKSYDLDFMWEEEPDATQAETRDI